MRWLADTDLGAAHGFARALCRGPYSDRAAPPNAGRLVELVPADVLMWDRVELATGVGATRGNPC